MKKRIVNKYVNRYINNIIRNLPTTEYGSFEIDKEGITKVIRNNLILVNGYLVDEGMKYNGCQDLLKNIKTTGALAARVVVWYKNVHLRAFDIRGNRVYLRLVTE